MTGSLSTAMFAIRLEQFVVLQAAAVRSRAYDLVDRVLGDPRFAGLDPRWCVERVLARRLTTIEAVRCYAELVLAARLDREPDEANRWLVARLDRADVTSPDARVVSSHEAWRRREAIALQNARLEEELLRADGGEE